MEQYQRFHVELPDMIVGPSSTIDATRLAGTCRLVHVDGGHKYEIVRQDAATARELLRPGGIVAFDDISTPHNPGSALAVWELVLGGPFRPLLLTDAKLYGTWDAGGVDWVARVDEWVAGEPDLGSDLHTLAGWPVRRLFAHGTAPGERGPARQGPGPRGHARPDAPPRCPASPSPIP